VVIAEPNPRSAAFLPTSKVAGPGTATRRAHRQANHHAIDMEMKLPASDHRHHAAEPEKQMENQLGTDRCA
jgi:hypothetical protein